MSEQPQPDGLDQQASDEQANEDLGFDYRASKDGKVFISWRGKTVTILKGKQAQQFLARISGLDAAGAQLVMAKITGNFKHGNERLAKIENRHGQSGS